MVYFRDFLETKSVQGDVGSGRVPGSPAWPIDGHSMKTNEALTKWLSEPRTALTKAVTECVGDQVANLRKQGVNPYGYALLPGEPYDLHSVVATYNCESDVKVPVGDKLYRYYRYSVDEWLHYIHDGFDRANQCMVDANAEFAAMHVDDGDGVMDDLEIAHSRALLEAILKGLEAAKHAGVFGEPVIYLAMWISDSAHEIIGQSVRRLNSANVVQEFRAEFG